MHELSIAHNLVAVAEQALRQAGEGLRAQRVNVRLGDLTCVHREALETCFRLVAADTLLAGAELHIEAIPITIYCAACRCEQTLPGIQSFRCPVCGTPSGDIRGGQELELESLEVADEEDAAPSDAACAAGPRGDPNEPAADSGSSHADPQAE